MNGKVKLGCQLLGLAAWATAWVGGSMWAFTRAMKKDTETRRLDEHRRRIEKLRDSE